MNVTIDDLMVTHVVVARPDDTVETLRTDMAVHSISAIPVADADGVPLGIVTISDLVAAHDPETPVSKIMSTSMKTVAQDDGLDVAARLMRYHRIHHVIVLDDTKIVGILSSYDLLRLVEDHQFVMKDAPAPSEQTTQRN